jgi:hypothetical protein
VRCPPEAPHFQLFCGSLEGERIVGFCTVTLCNSLQYVQFRTALFSIVTGMSFLSLSSLFGSSSTSGGESVRNDDDQVVERDSEEMDLHLSFSTTTHGDHNGSVISSGWQEIVLGVPLGIRTCIPRRDYGEEESLSGTIVSSAPTTNSDISRHERESHPHAPVALALSPDPHCDHVNALSVTTTESVYRNWQSLDNSMNTTNNDDQTGTSVMDMDLSLVDTLSSAPTLHSSLSCHDQVDGTSFRNVADRLALLSQSGGKWYSRFTEQDWVQLQQVADMVLHALEPDGAIASTTTTTSSTSQCEILHAFRCGSCHNVIAGAITLSCGCTVCTRCWETRNNWTACPSCQHTIEAAVPCHALDVAIANVTNARESNRRDLLLAELIEQEEECLYDNSESTCQSTLLFLGEYAMYVALASLWAVGMSTISRH